MLEHRVEADDVIVAVGQAPQGGGVGLVDQDQPVFDAIGQGGDSSAVAAEAVSARASSASPARRISSPGC
jgi:hypothetical protein